MADSNVEQLFAFRRVVWESLPILALVIAFELFAGGSLEFHSDVVLFRAPFLLAVLPAYLNAIGAVSSVYASRITTRLFLGELDRRLRPVGALFMNFAGPFLASITAFAAISAMAIAINDAFFALDVSAYLIAATVMLSGAASVAAMAAVGLAVAYISYLKGMHPGNVAPPLLTALGDAAGMALLVLCAQALLSP